MIWKKLVKIFLMGAVLNSCSAFPELHPYLISVKNGKCGEYKEVSKNPPQFDFVKWHDIIDCDGYIALPPDDVAAVQAWCKGNKQCQ